MSSIGDHSSVYMLYCSPDATGLPRWRPPMATMTSANPEWTRGLILTAEECLRFSDEGEEA